MEERDICRTETIEAEVESLMGIIQLVRAGVLQEQRTGFLIPSAVETILIEAENRLERIKRLLHDEEAPAPSVPGMEKQVQPGGRMQRQKRARPSKGLSKVIATVTKMGNLGREKG